jgi:lactoylglutathione lyase
MKLGNFSLSLNVKDIRASQKFYEALGFAIFTGDVEQGWLILKNETCVIGLFQGIIEKNTLTFNPGWDADAQPVNSFEDIRDIQKELKAKGIKFLNETESDGHGPCRFVILDPDGNPIMLDQHVDRPTL